jgi:hypothetical protein
MTATTDGKIYPVTSVAITGTQNTLSVSDNTNLVPGSQINFTGTSLIGGVSSTAGVSPNITTLYYYITHIVGNVIGVSTTLNGTPFTVTTSNGSMSYYTPCFPAGISYGISSAPVVSGTGPYTEHLH